MSSSKTREGFTLTFFDEGYRDALNLCGTKSGRDCDKVAGDGSDAPLHGAGLPRLHRGTAGYGVPEALCKPAYQGGLS
ncbi:MAG: hypothetical protein MZV63_42420 [Marinilabiliales bacterium]|nr:hypothetical protein [Marinilabiliales bacterium]